MQWIPFLSFVLAACYTPGPNIILSMNTARLFGFRKTIPLMTGMTVGLFAVMMLNAAANSGSRSVSQIVMEVEARAGIEPACKDLQSSA